MKIKRITFAYKGALFNLYRKLFHGKNFLQYGYDLFLS